MKSILVIGLGRFGRNLAMKMAELGNEVMAVDTDETLVSEIAPYVTSAQIGNCMNREILRSIGAQNFDVCFVCIGEDFQSSLEITSLLKELGAPLVVAKAGRDIQARLLKKIGADEVVYPERDMAGRTAVRYSAKGAFEYFELSPDYAIFEFAVPASWVGKTLQGINIRRKYSVNILAVKKGGTAVPMTDADYVFQEGEAVLAAGSKKDLLALVNRA